MAMRYPGGLIATSPVNAAYPSGVWTQSQTIPYTSQNVWQNDQYWRNTTLLLHGDGTNGAQNNTFLDSSSNNFSITRNGNTTQGAFTPYQQNGYWSNYFDGSSYLSISTASSTLDFGTGDFTIEMWVNPLTQATSFPTIISCASAWSAGAFYIRYSNSGAINKFGIYWNGVGDPFFVSSSTYQENTWHHVAVTRSGSTVTLWVNGVSAGTGTSSASLNLALGSGVWVGNNASASCNYKGYISNIRVVKGVAVYTSNFTPSTSPLTAITSTSFLTCQSNRFVDNSSNAFAITANGTPSVQAFQPFPGPTTWSASVLGGSGYFDGSGDYLSVAANAAFACTGDFTYETWFYSLTNAGSYNLYIGTSNNSVGNYFGIKGGSYVMQANNGGEKLWTGNPTVNAWTHIALVRSGSTVTVYQNGVSLGTNTDSNTFLTSTDSIYIANYAGYYPTGYFASTRLVKGTAVYTSAFTPPTSPLTAIVNTSLLLNFTNAGIFDNAQMNDLETVGNAQVSTSVVKYGTGSMAFDGSGDYLVGRTTDLVSFGTGDFTIEMWVNPSSVPASDRVLMDTRASGTDSGYTPYVNGGTLKIYSSAADRITSTTTISANVWTHIAFVRSSGAMAIYINGIQSGTATYTGSMTCPGRLGIGAGFDNAANFNGYIDDLRITKGVARYTANFTPPIARMPNQ